MIETINECSSIENDVMATNEDKSKLSSIEKCEWEYLIEISTIERAHVNRFEHLGGNYVWWN